jgi:hypothetical protein
MAKKVTRKGKVTHIVLDPSDTLTQVIVEDNLTMPGLVDALYEESLYVGYEEIAVTYEQDHEENYVRPKGDDMGHGCYCSKGSPILVGTKNIQRALKTGWRDSSRG